MLLCSAKIGKYANLDVFAINQNDDGLTAAFLLFDNIGSIERKINTKNVRKVSGRSSSSRE